MRLSRTRTSLLVSRNSENSVTAKFTGIAHLSLMYIRLRSADSLHKKFCRLGPGPTSENSPSTHSEAYGSERARVRPLSFRHVLRGVRSTLGCSRSNNLFRQNGNGERAC